MKSNRTVALIALASLSTALAFPGASKALPFTVGGQQYDVTTFSGSYDNDSSRFNTPGNGGAMPWWGNSYLAYDFAVAVNSELGLPNSFTGPTFAYSLVDNGLFFEVEGYNYSGTGILQPGYYSDSIATYATATLIPPSATPTPGPLPILGAAAAFGMSRRLRRRIASQAFKL